MSKAASDLATVLLQRVDCKALWEANTAALMSEGQLSHDMRDVESIVRKTIGDFREYNEDAMKEELFLLVWQAVKALLVTGLGAWYRERLANNEAELVDLGESGA